jgi:hypothetical protein
VQRLTASPRASATGAATTGVSVAAGAAAGNAKPARVADNIPSAISADSEDLIGRRPVKF